MKKIINKKTYNTETAEEIAEYNNGLGYTDWGYVSEELYRTKKGRFFLYVEGGPKSEYSKTNGRQTWGISDIIPYTDEEALNWLMKNNEVDIIEALFADVLEEA